MPLASIAVPAIGTSDHSGPIVGERMAPVAAKTVAVASPEMTSAPRPRHGEAPAFGAHAV